MFVAARHSAGSDRLAAKPHQAPSLRKRHLRRCGVLLHNPVPRDWAVASQFLPPPILVNWNRQLRWGDGFAAAFGLR
jgi:hypothetical protein